MERRPLIGTYGLQRKYNANIQLYYKGLDNLRKWATLTIAIVALLLGGAAIIWNSTQSNSLANNRALIDALNTTTIDQQSQLDILSMEQMDTELLLQELIANISAANAFTEEVIQTGTLEICGDACLEDPPPGKKSLHKRQFNAILADYTLSKVVISGTELFYLDIDPSSSALGEGLRLNTGEAFGQAHIFFAFYPYIPLNILVPPGALGAQYRRVLLSQAEKNKFTIGDDNNIRAFPSGQANWDISMASDIIQLENHQRTTPVDTPWEFDGRDDEVSEVIVNPETFCFFLHVDRYPSTVTANGAFRVAFPVGSRMPAPPSGAKK